MKVFLLATTFGLCMLSSVVFGQGLFLAAMDSVQEVPASTGASKATGTGGMFLNVATKQLYYRIAVNGLTGPLTAGHFHNGAAGVPGGVVKTLAFVNNYATGVWSSTDATQPLTDSLITELLNGRLYVNVHTSANPGGEIRGQVILKSGIGFTAKMDSLQEIPAPVGLVPGKGTFAVTLQTDGSITFDGTVTGLSGPIAAAHFHNGAAGVAGGVVKSITFASGKTTASGSWSKGDATQALTDILLRALINGQLYVNVHTAANGGGEIRGQVLVNKGSSAIAKMDSASEVPLPTGLVPGTGTGSFWLNGTGTAISYSITVNGLSGSLNSGHFHNAAAGGAAGVVKNLSFVNNTAIGTWSSTDATQPLTDSLLSEFIDGRLYINVHTTANPGGEIRGQVLPTTGIGFSAEMDSAQEIPTPVGLVPGRGTAVVMLGTDATVTYSVTVSGLSGPLTAGHFHDGNAGVAAGVVKGLTFVNNSASGSWTGVDATQALTDVLRRDLVRQKLYVNVHTSANPGGEIRGQVENTGANFLTAVVEKVSQEVPASFQLDQNYPNPFNPSTTISFALTLSGRVSLKVYNVLGQEIATLLDEVKSAGSYTATFDAARLSSGVYFYRLSAGAGYSQTKKMILMK